MALLGVVTPGLSSRAEQVDTVGFPIVYRVTGNWDGVGGDGVGVVYDDGNRMFWHLRNAPTVGPADFVFEYGTTGDVPVAGDWDGSGGDGPGITRIVNGTRMFWHLRNAPTVGPADYVFEYGVVGDIPTPGDWDGVGGDGPGITRIVNGTRMFWHLRRSPSPGPADYVFEYGSVGDIPTPGDWDGVGGDGPGITRIVNGTRMFWHLRRPPGPGPADYVFEYGSVGDFPTPGDWDGVGGDGPGITRVVNDTRIFWHLRRPPSAGPTEYVFEYGAANGAGASDGMLVRHRSEDAVYYIENGYRHWVTSPDVLAAMGRTMAEVHIVGDGALNPLPRGADVVLPFTGHAELTDPDDSHASANGWRFKDLDTTHRESDDAKARVVGGVTWYNGSGKFWLHRANVYNGTKAYAVENVGCIWVQLRFGYPLASVTFPPTLSIAGAAEDSGFYRSCRQGSETKPSPINLTGLSYAKAYLSSVTFTICTSNNAAEGRRWCSNEKELYGDPLF